MMHHGLRARLPRVNFSSNCADQVLRCMGALIFNECFLIWSLRMLTDTLGDVPVQWLLWDAPGLPCTEAACFSHRRWEVSYNFKCKIGVQQEWNVPIMCLLYRTHCFPSYSRDPVFLCFLGTSMSLGRLSIQVWFCYSTDVSWFGRLECWLVH